MRDELAESINMESVEEGQKQQKGSKLLDDYYRMGRYTAIVCCLAQLLLLAEVGDLLFMAFASAPATVQKCGQLHFDANFSAKQRCERLKMVWHHPEEMEHLQCTNTTIKPVDLSYQFRSVVVDFDNFYCKADLVKLTMPLQTLGIIFGSVLFGWLSDAYGRRFCMLGALICWVLTMAAASFTSSFVLFTVLRFIVLFFNAGIAVTSTVFTSELYPKKQRFCLTNIFTWAPNYIALGLIAYLVPDWRWLQRVLALLALPCIALIAFLDESARFLVSARRIPDAKKAIVRMHKIDGRPCDEALLDAVLERECLQMVEQSAKKRNYNYLHLFYTWELARFSVVLAFSHFTTNLITYGLVYNIGSLSGSMFLNMVFMGTFKYSMNLFAVFADLSCARLGRKMAHLGFESLVVVALALYITLHLTHLAQSVPQLANWTLITAIGFCGVLTNTNKLVSSELFPTQVRNLSCSFAQVCNRLGVLFATTIFMTKNICTSEVCAVLPQLILLAIAVVDVVIFQLVIRETKGAPLISEFPSRSDWNWKVTPSDEKKKDSTTLHSKF